MIVKPLTAACIAAGLLLCGIGVQRWFDRHAAAEVIDDFMTALADGDREAALLQLQPKRRKLVEAEQKTSSNTAWKPVVGVTYRIHSLDLDGPHAVARLLVEKNGFALKPTLHLKRNKGTRWKIDRIDGLQIDPLWHDLEEQRARSQGEQLAAELAQAFEKRSSVTVERGTAGNADQPGR